MRRTSRGRRIMDQTGTGVHETATTHNQFWCCTWVVAARFRPGPWTKGQTREGPRPCVRSHGREGSQPVRQLQRQDVLLLLDSRPGKVQEKPTKVRQTEIIE